MQNHPALVVRDDENEAGKLHVERKVFDAGDSIELHLSPGGGYIARFADN
jgi:hypothetical protein